MWLVNGICVVVAELVYNFRDTIMVAFGECRSDGGFEAIGVLRQLCVAHTIGGHDKMDVGLPCAQRESFAFVSGAASTCLRPSWRQVAEVGYDILKSTTFPLVVQLILQRS
jgi:hypothetical protein